MTTRPRPWLRWLTGQPARVVLLALGLTLAWLWWEPLPPEPLRVWSMPEDYADLAFLSRDHSTLVTVVAVRHGGSPARPSRGRTGPVRLWDVATGRERLHVLTAETRLAQVRLAPDGSWLLTQDWRDGLSLWDTATGQRRGELRPPGDAIGPDIYLELSFSTDGRVIAGAQPDGRAVQLWESATGRLLATLVGARGPFAFTPDGRALLTATPDPVAKLWDVATGRERFALPGHAAPVSSVAVSPDGRRLATGLHRYERRPGSGQDAPTAIKLWDTETGTRLATIDVTDEPRHAEALQFSPDGRWLVIRSLGGRGLVWDMTTDTPQGRDDLIESTEWDAWKTGRRLNSIFLSFAPDGRRWLTGVGEGHSLVLVEPPDARQQAILRPGRYGKINSADHFSTFSPDGRTIAIGVHYDLPAVEQRISAGFSRLLGRRSLTSHRHTVRLFDADSGRTLLTLPASGMGYRLLGFGADGQTLWTDRADWATNRHTRVFERWAVPASLPGPPGWLLGVTALGVLLAVADWRRNRRRVVTIGA